MRERRIPPPVPGFRQVQFSAWLCRCDIKNFCRDAKLVPHDARTALVRTRGRKARREGGGYQDNPRDEQPIRSVLERDKQPIRGVPEPASPSPSKRLPSHTTPKQPGTGQKCSTRTNTFELNICAPKPRKRVPLLYPVPGSFKVEQAASGSSREKSLFFRVG